MRKNLIPLLAIALVVAVLSTAVFYGLIADRLAPPKSASANTGAMPMTMLVAARNVDRGKVLESADVRVADKSCPPGQPCVTKPEDALGRATLDPLVEGQTLTESSLSVPAGSAPSSVIPMGMRAVTMHVADSQGVVQMLRTGDHVDIQMIGGRDPANPNVLEVRSVMPSVEVLNVGPPEIGSPLAGRPVVTVLLSPADADRVSLADTVGRLRIVLRNRQDVDKAGAKLSDGAAPKQAPKPEPKTTAMAAPVASRTATPSGGAAPAVASPAGAAQTRDIYFDVRWISPKRDDTLDILGGHFSPNGEALQVLPVIGDKSWDKLESEGRLAVVAKSQLLTHESGEVSLERDGRPGLKIRLVPHLRSDGRLGVRVEPSVKSPGGAERRVRSDLAFSPGDSFLVAGLEGPDGLFAVITPRMVKRDTK